jgi:predicted SprT family Zn-dependent metalloprotease
MPVSNDDRNNRTNEDRCGKCGADIDSTRRVDFTLKDGTRVCDSCFVKGTRSPTHAKETPYK